MGGECSYPNRVMNVVKLCTAIQPRLHLGQHHGQLDHPRPINIGTQHVHRGLDSTSDLSRNKNRSKVLRTGWNRMLLGLWISGWRVAGCRLVRKLTLALVQTRVRRRIHLMDIDWSTRLDAESWRHGCRRYRADRCPANLARTHGVFVVP